MFRTVSLGVWLELNGSFGIYVTMTDIPIIFECQVADSWRHKFDLWRHRGDTVSFMSTIHSKYSTEMHQNTHSMQNWTGNTLVKVSCRYDQWFWRYGLGETKKSRNFRKFDLWPAITGSNIDLGPKIIPPLARTRRAQSAGLFREALWRFFWKSQGGGGSHQHRRRWQNTVY